VKAIPVEHKYSVQVSAEGYGTARSEFDADDANESRVDVASLELPLANLSLEGVVVDSEENPVDGADVQAYGDNQPNVRARTDKEGKFVLEGVCEGRVSLHANKSGTTFRYGSAQAQGGATDVTITIAESGSQSRSVVREPMSLVGRQLPDMKGLGVEPLPDANGKMLLVAFWDMAQRPSRHCVTQLARMADELAGEGVVTVVVQASEADREALQNWVQEYKMPFASGMLGEDAEKVRLAWGVKSLPWLILTDKQHVVKADGFPLGELKAKMEEVHH
jgi:hypothetical protein